MELPVAEEQQVFAMLKAGHPHISTAEIFRVMADPVNRISPLTQQSLLVNCMNQLQRVEKSRPAVATETLVSTESLIGETPVPHPRTSTPLDFPTVEDAMKVSGESLIILDCPVPASLEHVAILEAEKPKDSELIRWMLTPEAGADFTNGSKPPVFVEPVLKALEKQSAGLEVEELGAVAPEGREVYIVPGKDTWSMHEQPSGKCQIKSAEKETWTETETSTASYDKWIREVEQEEPVPPLVYPVLTKNMTSRKRCIFEACTVTTKKLREHVERTHIPWSVSRQCLDLERAKQFLKLLGKELGAHSFRELLRITLEQKLYPAAELTKALSAADQESMQLFERHINGRANFLLTVSPTNSVGSLIHLRLIAGLMNYFGHQDTTTLTPIEQQVLLSGILYGDVVDAHCHLQEFLQGKRGVEIHGLKKTIYNYGPRAQQNVNIAALVSAYCFPDEVPYPNVATRATWKMEEIPVYCCLGLHPKVCNESRDYLLDQLDQQLMFPDVVAVGEVGLHYSGFRVNRNCQKNMLKQLVRMAKFGGFPIVIHCRDNPGSSTAYFDCMKVLESELLPTHPVYLHCFTAGIQVFEAWQKVFPGMYFGFSPKIVWGTHHVECLDVVKRISLSNILLESDCPFLPNRDVGEPQNTPWSIVNVAQKISEVVGQNTLTIMKYTARNAKDFYNI